MFPQNNSLSEMANGRVSRTFGDGSSIDESSQYGQHRLSVLIARADAYMRYLQDFQQSLWDKLYPGRELDGDLLLKEIRSIVQNSGGTAEDRDALQKLNDLHHMQRERTEYLGCSAARLHFDSSLPHVPQSMSVYKQPTHGSHFWAVIIGINDYDDPSTPRLRGSINDALAMHAYLTHDLSVPLDHICLLTQSQGDCPPVWAWPTCQNILAALYTHLRDNPCIRTGDHILIYFSGHGSAYYASDAFSSPTGGVGSIEALCPADRGTLFGPDPQDVVCDISDREVNVFLGELRDAKGPHITVILDCCYSGGMARAAPAPRSIPRFTSPLTLMGMLRAADADPRRLPASRRVCVEAWVWDTSACVLLAACQDYEQAYERPAPLPADVHGAFTYVLLRALRCRDGETTYADLMKAVGQDVAAMCGPQHPVVVGDRSGCRIWFM